VFEPDDVSGALQSLFRCHPDSFKIFNIRTAVRIFIVRLRDAFEDDNAVSTASSPRLGSGHLRVQLFRNC